MSTNDSKSPGTAPAAKLEKAGCGFRFSEGELQEGIDFSKADQLLPTPAEDEAAADEETAPDNDASPGDEHR